MDVLSDAVLTMRWLFRTPTGTCCAPRGGSASRRPTAPLPHRARRHLLAAPGGAERVRLAGGDIVLLPREPGHALADEPGSPLVPFQPGRRDRHDEPGAGAVTELLCGAYVLDRWRPHPLLADLPDVVHLPAHIGRHPRLRAAVGLLGAELAEPGAGTGASVSALLDLLLLYMLRAWFEEMSAASPTGWPAALADPAVSAALEAMHAEPAAPWTVARLADRAGLLRTVFA